MNKKFRVIAQIVLGVVAVVLAYFLYESIMEPVRFDQEVQKRSAVLKDRLKDIRTVEEAYKKSYGKFIGDIDSIVIFLENGDLPYVKMIGNVPDSLTEEEAVKKGIVSREVFTEKAYEVLFANKVDENGNKIERKKHLENIIYIPFTNRTEKISLQAGFIEKNGYKMPVFEAKAPFSVMLQDLDKVTVDNYCASLVNLNRYPGMLVGSMTEAITTGNFE